jgi:hypothetical protein
LLGSAVTSTSAVISLRAPLSPLENLGRAEIHMAIPQSFLDALPSSRRTPDIAEADDIFGFLIGSWEIDAVLYNADGQRQTSKGEVHATWVLEGRAIQDLFIFPRRADRSSGIPARGNRYATTIRNF